MACQPRWNLEGNAEIEDFNKKLMTKLGYDPAEGEMASMFEKLSQSSPQLVDAMQKMQSEDKKLEVVPIKSKTIFRSIPNPNDESEDDEESSGGGILGGLKKKAAGKVMGGESETMLELNSDILNHSTAALDAGTFAVPEKYKLKD